MYNLNKFQKTSPTATYVSKVWSKFESSHLADLQSTISQITCPDHFLFLCASCISFTLVSPIHVTPSPIIPFLVLDSDAVNWYP